MCTSTRKSILKDREKPVRAFLTIVKKLERTDFDDENQFRTNLKNHIFGGTLFRFHAPACLGDQPGSF